MYGSVRAVHTNPSADRCTDRPLPGGTIDWGCFRPIWLSFVGHLQYSRHFLYSSPAQPLGAEDMTWRMVCFP
ncbi:hypothetical protein GW17_00048885 [Ensete ventricosum]|nr:hypothetical protein GW17_00048885 [Ensete ventricosum]